jgi:hypothetical protein
MQRWSVDNALPLQEEVNRQRKSLLMLQYSFL